MRYTPISHYFGWEVASLLLYLGYTNVFSILTVVLRD
jgi:hypothetical protein